MMSGMDESDELAEVDMTEDEFDEMWDEATPVEESEDLTCLRSVSDQRLVAATGSYWQMHIYAGSGAAQGSVRRTDDWPIRVSGAVPSPA